MAELIGDLDVAIGQDFVPSIAGFGMEKTVTVFNPMPADFQVKYTRSAAINAPLSAEAQFAKEKAGLDLSRRGQVSGHTTHTLILKAGSVTNLPGDIAQIAVQKLITVIIQTRNDDGSYDFEGRGGHKNLISDGDMRKAIQDEVVRSIKDTMALMNRETVEDFTQRQITEMNEVVEDEPTDNPAPGTGGTYTPAQTIPTGAGQPDSTEPDPTPDPGQPAKRKPGRPKASSITA